MIAQDKWIEENCTKYGIKPWVCKCGKEATLHRTTNKKHEFLCNDCIEKEES